MALITVFKGKGPSGFGYGSTAEDVTAGMSLAGKHYLVTGCNSGLGLETLRVLKLRGAHVLGGARTVEKARGAGAQTPLACELTDVASIRACIDSVKKSGIKLDGIICNAGIMAIPKLQQVYGTELHFFNNHVGHFILVNGLLDSLTDEGRVVTVSSDLHNLAPKTGIAFDNLVGEKAYNPWVAYAQSKFANLLFVKALSKRLAGTKKTANALHPGVICTNITRHCNALVKSIFTMSDPLFLKNMGQGAATHVYVATHPSLANVNGEYFADCNLGKRRPDANDAALAERLWETTERIVANTASQAASPKAG